MLVIDSTALREAMMKEGVGVKELSKRCGISHAVISIATRQDKPCSIRTVGKISKTLKIEPSEIIKQ